MDRTGFCACIRMYLFVPKITFIYTYIAKDLTTFPYSRHKRVPIFHPPTFQHDYPIPIIPWTCLVVFPEAFTLLRQSQFMDDLDVNCQIVKNANMIFWFWYNTRRLAPFRCGKKLSIAILLKCDMSFLRVIWYNDFDAWIWGHGILYVPAIYQQHETRLRGCPGWRGYCFDLQLFTCSTLMEVSGATFFNEKIRRFGLWSL